MFKSFLPAIALVLGLITGNAHAGTEDWTGQFRVKMGSEVVDAHHSPAKVQFMFMSAGKCITLHQGATINGVKIPQDVSFCTDTNVPNFINEMNKLGVIQSQNINRGQSYHD